MLTAVAVVASLVFIGWLVYRAVRQKPIRAHIVTRAIAYVTALYTFAFFLDMDIPLLLKVMVSIIIGGILIVLGATLQRRRESGRS